MRPAGHGLTWLAEWLNERYNKASCVVIDGRGGAEVLVERIHTVWKAKNSVIRPAARDVVAAAGVFITAVNEGGLTWYRPQQGLNESAVSAVKRPVAGGLPSAVRTACRWKRVPLRCGAQKQVNATRREK